MRKLLSGLALVALVAASAQAKPGGGNGGGHGNGGGNGGGNPHAIMGGGGPGNGHGNGGGGEGGGHGRGGGEMRRVEMATPWGGRGNGHGGGEMRQMRMAAPGEGRGNGHRGGEMRQMRMAAPGGGHGNSHGGAEMRRENRQFRDAMRPHRGNERNVERHAERGRWKAERAVRQDERRSEQAALRPQDLGNARIFTDTSSRRFSGQGRALIDGCPPGLAKKNNGCMPPGLAAKMGTNPATGFTTAAGAGLLANTLTPSWFGFDDYGPDYRYYDGYLLRTNGNSVLGYVPLLGGALAPGRPWLAGWEPAPIPAYWTDYYDLGPVDRYRYYDDVLYQLDPGRSEIDEIVALMTGDPWAVGEPMPYDYQVYNVPYGYRTQYYDTGDHWYRYADGYIYDVDPTTRLVRAVIQLLGGTPLPGQPWRASYQAAPIPAYWRDYYNLGPLDRYRYYDDVIYELNSGHDEIDNIVAVTAGDTWAVGSRMPYGYDVYNVPYAYRGRYLDGPDHWYRYSDGYVYDIDPTTRLVLAAAQLLA